MPGRVTAVRPPIDRASQSLSNVLSAIPPPLPQVGARANPLLKHFIRGDETDRTTSPADLPTWTILATLAASSSAIQPASQQHSPVPIRAAGWRAAGPRLGTLGCGLTHWGRIANTPLAQAPREVVSTARIPEMQAVASLCHRLDGNAAKEDTWLLLVGEPGMWELVGAEVLGDLMLEEAGYTGLYRPWRSWIRTRFGSVFCVRCWFGAVVGQRLRRGGGAI